MAVNVILNSEYNVYANIFDNNVGRISYPTRDFLYNSNSSNLFANCNKLKMDLGQMKGNWSLVTNMARSFYNCTNITGAPFFPTNVTNIINTYYNCYSLTGSFPQDINVNNMYGTFYNCQKLTGNPSSGNNLVDISYCYYNINNMAGTIYLNYNGTAAVNATNAFYGRDTSKKLYIQVKPNSKWNNWFYNNCSIYGNTLSWISLHNRYYNLNSSTVVKYGDGYGDVYLNQLNFTQNFGKSSISMINLIEMDKHNILDIEFTTNNANSFWIHNSSSTELMKINKISSSILSSAPFSEINIYFNPNCAYMLCNMRDLNFNLQLGNSKGSFRGEHITNLTYAFRNCQNLYFNIENFSLNNCINMYGAFLNCWNLTGPAICGDNVVDISYAYYNCVNITSAIFGNNVINYQATYYYCNNIKKIIINCPNVINIGTSAFSSIGLGLGNVTNIIFGGNCTYAVGAFRNFISLNNTVEITIGDPVQNIVNIFNNCQNCKIINLNISNSVINMSDSFSQCYNLIGPPACGDNVVNMSEAYYRCYNLIGSPVCGNKVTNMAYTYGNCYNLTGSPVCGNKVTNMYRTYENCYNLTGSPVCGNNVISMDYAYYKCYNLTGNVILSSNINSLVRTFQECSKLSTIVIPRDTALLMDSMSYMCWRYVFTTRLNVIVINQTTYTRLRGNTTWANASFTASATHSETIVVNGISYVVKNWAYNTARNVYLYCTA